MNIAVVQNELANVPLADIDIAVQLGNRASMDFSDTKSIIELGYMAAAQNQMALEKLSISPERMGSVHSNAKIAGTNRATFRTDCGRFSASAHDPKECRRANSFERPALQFREADWKII